MNTKEFYEAPKWGTRVVMVERQFLNETSPFSDSNIEIPGEEEGGDA